MPPTDFSIDVVLTPLHNIHDQRKLTLTPSGDIIIGRASKSETKGYHASSTNALFDSPVISRQHAVLKAHPWAAAGEQVTVTDTSSMHGTFVNGQALKSTRPFTLQSGDRIKFGNRVARGDDAFEGVTVIYGERRARKEGTQRPSATTRSFVVPSGSDNESDCGSDVLSYIEDDEDLSTSAQTTPESKSIPGSQKSPIDVDDRPTSSFKEAFLDHEDIAVNLDNPDTAVSVVDASEVGSLIDENEASDQEPSAASKVIADSYNLSPDLLAPDSYKQNSTHLFEKSAQLLKSLHSQADALSREIDVSAPLAPAEDIQEDLDGDASVRECVDLPLSWSDEPVYDRLDLRSISSISDDQGPEVMSTKVQPSTNSNIADARPAMAVPKARYDPVRGSPSPTPAELAESTVYPINYLGPFAAEKPQLPAPARPDPYVNRSLPVPGAFGSSADLNFGSEWSTSKDGRSHETSRFGSGVSPYYVSSVPYCYGWGEDDTHPSYMASNDAPLSHNVEVTAEPQASHCWSYPQPKAIPTSKKDNASPVCHSGITGYTTPVSSENAASSTTVGSVDRGSPKVVQQTQAKMSIPHIVGDAGVQNINNQTSSGSTNQPSGALKRKAEAIDDNRPDNGQDADNTSNSLQKLQVPGRKTSRRVKKIKTHHKITTLSVAKEVGKYAFGAAMGVTGTFAFLSSSMGEKAVEWVSSL